jgi:hypothetical protein
VIAAFLHTIRKPIPLALLSMAFLLSLAEWAKPNRPHQVEQSKLPKNELFDPQLFRIQNIAASIRYCDSIYGNSQVKETDSATYVNLVSRFIKNRFYHGYSNFSFGYNTIGWALAPILHKDLSATVIPDDILKFPNGACSQQSIVFFEVVRRKGFVTRKVGLFDSTRLGGHFVSEVFWQGNWHYYDVNKEPNDSILEKLGRPSLDMILQTPGLIDSVYVGKTDINIQELFKHPVYGKPNQSEAPNATIYQQVTKTISLTLPLWVMIAIGIWVLIFGNKKPAEAGANV